MAEIRQSKNTRKEVSTEPPQYNGGLLGLQKREYLAKMCPLQTTIPDSFSLLLVEVLYGGEIFKNEEEVLNTSLPVSAGSNPHFYPPTHLSQQQTISYHFSDHGIYPEPPNFLLFLSMIISI
jgi:hypothetical protein